MKHLSVGIVKSDFHGHHSTSWTSEWLDACHALTIPCELVDWRTVSAFARLSQHPVVLWHFSHYSSEEMKFARSILAALKAAGCTVFPDAEDSWHFDDKVAQAYLFRGLGVPTPKNYALHGMAAVESWIAEIGTFPVVAKLRSGSGASNVTLLQTVRELRKYSRRMFGHGLSSAPSLAFKAKSNLSSSHSYLDVIRRLRRAPEFLFSLRSARNRERERGYVYLQEFIPHVDHDLKVVVVGDQLSFIGRRVRKGDFRASGGGDLFYDRDLITPAIVETAFVAAELLGSDCTGFDMFCDPATSRPLILEVSYGFSHTALLSAGGHFDRQGIWHETPLNAPRAILLRMIQKAKAQ